MTKSEKLFAAAEKYLGTTEIPGSKSNPRISAWIHDAATWLDHDDSSTPWCGCFRGAIGVETATGVPPEHFRAKQWARWGVPVNGPAAATRGDTVILHRTGGFHVAFFNSYNAAAGTVNLLGGNQGDSVKFSNFPVSSIFAIRR